jgi:hypothetical protein
MFTLKLVLLMLSHIIPGSDRTADPSVTSAIVVIANDPKVAMTPREFALMVTYDDLESMAHEHPISWSWDSKAGVSCGSLQLPCGFVQHATVLQQHYYWLRELRAAGLASLDSDPKRAAKREARAMKVLGAAESELSAAQIESAPSPSSSPSP